MLWYNYLMKTCRTCEREYNPSSRHKDCPACRATKSKTPCIDCGKPCGRVYSRCGTCLGIKQTGEASPSWKGGRIKHKAGYVMIRVPEHPRSKSNNGYVFEHILVMEDLLGRNLLPGENIHHLNGVKDDNRPENLELWIRPQPSGIRAKDALTWAYEIIELYETTHGSNKHQH